ncbi:chromate transporter [Marinobacterium stanieri]|uniref:Chromate transporter n=2 Tax=Marinobacterium stanieri TaxID=49186 RepID=A0A1N6UKM2_9GAMM|nr:chromate transporter [Marinobacterium stanieri]
MMTPEKPASVLSILLIFLRLGLTSFGGPVAHIGYFREEFVNRRKWLSDQSYADLVALCQFLPGPASSQVGLALGMFQGGFRGALAAWCGFTLPSAIALILVAYGATQPDGLISAGVVQGLKLIAVAVVAHAVWGMAQNLCRGRIEIAIMLAAACAMLVMPTVWLQPALILLAALVGWLLLERKADAEDAHLPVKVSLVAGKRLLLIFAALLVLLPLLTALLPSAGLTLFDLFYRIGSLVFGGGHVVLPLLQAETVPTGMISDDLFLAGYGAAQAVPGPLFTFAAYLGTAMNTLPGWLGGLIALVAIFTPSFLLVAGVLPFWEQLRRRTGVRAALAGVNAAVVGLLLAALYNPIWTGTLHAPVHFALVLLAFAALQIWKLPVWLLVLLYALGGWLA